MRGWDTGTTTLGEDRLNAHGSPPRRVALIYTGEIDFLEAATDALRLRGCTCDPPDVQLVAVDRVRVFHDLECPLCPPEYREP